MVDWNGRRKPDIFRALRFGAVLENVVYDARTRAVAYEDISLTENTRGCYPIEFVPQVETPCAGSHPRHVIFLVCDAFGVLPPVARLTAAQAEYHFISGYSAKMAGTEVGVTKPEATFSPGFGGAFLVWHPTVYSALLAERLHRHNSETWLLNTGWSAGPAGASDRIRLRHSPRDAQRHLTPERWPRCRRSPTRCSDWPPTACPALPRDILLPRQRMADTAGV